jgi:hypothetical protein
METPCPSAASSTIVDNTATAYGDELASMACGDTTTAATEDSAPKAIYVWDLARPAGDSARWADWLLLLNLCSF